MLALNLAVNIDFSRPKVRYILLGDTLHLELPNKVILVDSYIEKLELQKIYFRDFIMKR